MKKLTYFTEDQREALASQVMGIIKANIENDWKDILGLAIKQADLPEDWTFDDEGEEAYEPVWDLLYSQTFINVDWEGDSRTLALKLTYDDE